MEMKMTDKITINTLIEAGCHFGHQTMRWNPKMKPYIFGKRGDIHIIDLKKTLVALDQVYTFVRELSAQGKTVLFVGTKKQAQEAIADAANRCGMPYVNARWLGGFLTNFQTIRTRVKYMEKLETEEADGRAALYTKKEQILRKKELIKLQTSTAFATWKKFLMQFSLLTQLVRTSQFVKLLALVCLSSAQSTQTVILTKSTSASQLTTTQLAA